MHERDGDRVARAIGFLEANARRQPSLDEVAAAVQLSPYHFQRLFKRWAGVSPKRFLQFLTIGHAKSALAEGQSVLDATYDSGLSSAGRLHDLFVAVDAVTPGEFKDRGEGITIRYGFHDSPFGLCLLGLTERGVCALAFVDDDTRHTTLDGVATRWPEADVVVDQSTTRATVDAIFTSDRPDRPVSLDLRGTNFQLKVWEALLRIPPGALASYGDVADSIGQPTAQRAVGAAVARNPVAYLIPCHRVIRGSGAFGSYRWGAERKKAIVGWEAARREQSSRPRVNRLVP
jgi:AraC family transcriptional regulator of adaptative response/methylated-DNA-[protein]-cysteine methyltransferase